MAEISNLICSVDDDASLRRPLGRFVRSFGFDVQLLESGRANDVNARPKSDFKGDLSPKPPTR